MIPQNATPAAVSSATTTIAEHPQAFDVDPEVARGPLAQREQVQPAREEQRADDAEDHERRDHADVRPAGPVEGAELPEHDLLAGLRVAEEREEGQARAADGVHRDAGEHQRDHLGAAGGPREPVDERTSPRGRRRTPRRRWSRDPATVSPSTMVTDAADGGAGRRRRRRRARRAGCRTRPASAAPAVASAAPDQGGHGDAREPDGPQRGVAVRVRGHAGRGRGRRGAAGSPAPRRAGTWSWPDPAATTASTPSATTRPAVTAMARRPGGGRAAHR